MNEPKSFYIVLLGMSVVGHTMYPDYHSAECEAKKLASEYPNQTYYILETVSACRTKKPDVETVRLSGME